MTKVFCGANQTKIPLALVTELQPLGLDAEYIQIDGTGRNALDFHIAYYIGRLSKEFPGAVFYIVSKDTGFDPLIKHLKAQGTACHRVSSLSSIARSALRPPTSSLDRTQRVVDSLLNRSKGRPLTRKALTAFIKGQLNAQGTEATVNEVIERLKQSGVSILPDGKVKYPSP